MTNFLIKKGSILSGEEEGINLRVISYNGYAIKIKIGFLKKDYEIVEKVKIAEYKEEIENNLSLTQSNSDENVIEYKNKCYHMKCYLIFIIAI